MNMFAAAVKYYNPERGSYDRHNPNPDREKVSTTSPAGGLG
jgi:hypothetical protein